MKSKRSDKLSKTVDHDFEAFEQLLGEIPAVDNTIQPDSSVKSEDDSSETFLGPSNKEIIFVTPDGQQPVFPEYMIASSREIQNILAAEEVVVGELQQARVLVALPGDLLAYEKGDECSQDAVPLQAGPYVKQTEKGEYFAEKYGFVCLTDNHLTVLQPLKISRDKLKVEWLVPPKHPSGVECQMLEFWLQENEVRVKVAADLDESIKKVNGSSPEAALYTVASGKAPVHGEDGYIEWVVELGGKLGKELPDGRIDFRERDYAVSVKANQIVARLKPPTRGMNGRDVNGRFLTAVDGRPVQLITGNSIIKRQVYDDIEYIAVISGALHYSDNTVSVAEVLILSEDVDYKTGNIDFVGDVVVKGSLASGFLIKATGNVIVSGNAENGSRIEAKGDVIVGNSIVGKRTDILAGGDLRTQYVHEATVKTGGHILLGSYAFHARLKAGGIIKVEKGAIHNGGSIMGGEARAIGGIDTYTAGTPAWGQTDLMAGISAEESEKLDELENNIEGRNAHIRQILDHFGLTSINLGKIRQMIENAEGVQRKSIALRAKYLAQAGKNLQGLLAEKEQIMTNLGPAPDEIEIEVRERAYPNVTVRIGNETRKLDSELDGIRFYKGCSTFRVS